MPSQSFTCARDVLRHLDCPTQELGPGDIGALGARAAAQLLRRNPCHDDQHHPRPGHAWEEDRVAGGAMRWLHAFARITPERPAPPRRRAPDPGGPSRPRGGRPRAPCAASPRMHDASRGSRPSASRPCMQPIEHAIFPAPLPFHARSTLSMEASPAVVLSSSCRHSRLSRTRLICAMPSCGHTPGDAGGRGGSPDGGSGPGRV